MEPLSLILSALDTGEENFAENKLAKTAVSKAV